MCAGSTGDSSECGDSRAQGSQGVRSVLCVLDSQLYHGLTACPSRATVGDTGSSGVMAGIVGEAAALPGPAEVEHQAWCGCVGGRLPLPSSPAGHSLLLCWSLRTKLLLQRNVMLSVSAMHCYQVSSTICCSHCEEKAASSQDESAAASGHCPSLSAQPDSAARSQCCTYSSQPPTPTGH